MLENVRKVFRQFLSDEIPQKVTNVFYQMWTGIEAVFEHLETKIDIMRRERNILTATKKSSLRNLAAGNGYEPTLRIPSQGVVTMELPASIFTQYSYPLFVPAYAEFRNKENGLIYLYNSDKALRVVDIKVSLPLIEGMIASQNVVATGEHVQRIYLTDANIANESIVIECNNVRYKEVKSFFNNDGVNDNKQFIVKFGVDAQKPIVLYVKGASENETLQISYRLTFGEEGILTTKTFFECDDVIDINGSPVDLSSDEVYIYNSYGFTMGSNGDDENSLKAAIGYNHGNTLLFDKISYGNFLGKFSTLLLQNIYTDENKKSIVNIFLSKKQSLDSNNISEDNTQLIYDYKRIINGKLYILSNEEKSELNNIINDNEFCLSSHVLNDAQIIKYAIQVMFDNIRERDTYSKKIAVIIYAEFAKLLYDRNHVINFEVIFKDFMKANQITLDYYIMNEISSTEYVVGHIIKHTDKLPILQGDFSITDEDGVSHNVFNDINFVIKS